MLFEDNNNGMGIRVIRMGGFVSNVWLVRSKEHGPVLIDAGFSLMWPWLVLELRQQGLLPGDLTAVILTHRHRDHADNAIHFLNAGVPVYAHRLDANILTGQDKAVVLKGRWGPVAWMAGLENRHPVRLDSVETLEDHDRVFGFDVIHCPGHTCGSIFLYQPETKALFTGDGLLNAVPPYVYKTALSLPYPDFCDDYNQALHSLRCFLSLKIGVNRMYPGHGPARKGPIQDDLQRLLDYHGM